MAKCIPPKIIDKDSTPGERKLFRLLKKLPDDSCFVYFELMIGERDFRPDFVIIDIEHGVTIIEVKDWGIDTIKKATEKVFRVLSNRGFIRSTKNPQEKVKIYLEEIREQMSTREVLCNERGRVKINIRYFVAFPNINESDFFYERLNEVIDSDYVLFAEELADNDSFLKKYYTNYQQLSSRLNREQWNSIRISLFPELAIPDPENIFIFQDSKVISQDSLQEFTLDSYQEQLAKSLGRGPRLLRGIAGTGKTIILLLHAKLSSANSKAKGVPTKILFLCWNISLAQYLRHAYDKLQIPNADDIEILHFSEFARSLLKKYGYDFPSYRSNGFEEKLTEILNEIPIQQEDTFDTVYIDEAQDFQKEWIGFIFNELLRGEPTDRNLIIAGDDAQHIYKNRNFPTFANFTWKSIGIPMRGRSAILRKIYRNSARVWAFAVALSQDLSQYFGEDKSEVKFAPKKGYDPELISCSTLDEQIKVAIGLVDRIAESGYSPRNVMILYPRRAPNGFPLIHRLTNKLDQKNIKYQWITEDNEAKTKFLWADDSVKISTVHSAKGMDAPVIIILCAESFMPSDDLWDQNDQEKLMYVALTRAREYLLVLHTDYGGIVPQLYGAMEHYKKYRNRIVQVAEESY